MKLSNSDVVEEDTSADSSTEFGGLLGQLSAYHIRILTENVMNGGCGYSYDQVGQMTLDQVFHRLCDKELLKLPVGERTKKIKGAGYLKPGPDGKVAGVAADGSRIRGRVGGKSKARMLMEEHQARLKEENEKKKQGRRKRHRSR